MESVYYGRYELLEKIAAGGMAEVFKAKYQGFGGLEKTVVVKRILPQYSHDQEFVRMFVDEAKIAVALSHVNLVQTFDFGQVDGNYYLAMEYVSGPDLQSILRECHYRRIPIPMELSVYLASEILRGLDYAHRRRDPSTNKPLNIVHRDISPANILLGYSGNIKVADFGIAKAKLKTSQTQHGTLKGKYSYMSPEQARGEDVDARSDIFSCGIILYELVTGVRPFRGKSELEILEKVKAARVENPRKVNPHIPKRLADIIVKALTRDRNDRFQEAGTMGDRLTSVLGEFPNRADQEAMSAFVRRVFQDKKVRKGRTSLDALVEEAMKKPAKRAKSRADGDAAAGGEPIHYAVAVIRYVAPSDDDQKERTFLAKAEVEINTRGGKIEKSGAGEIIAYFEEDPSKSKIAQRTDYRRVAVDATRKVVDLGAPTKMDLGVTAGVCAGEVPRMLTEASVSEISASIKRATMLAVRAGNAKVLIEKSVAKGLGKMYALRQVVDDDGTVVYAPVRASARPAVERRSQQGDRTFGRDDERERLTQALKEVLGGRGRAVAILGEPGMGKSHLVLDMIRRAAGDDYQIFLGRCSASGTHVPFSVFQDLIRDMVGLPEGTGPMATREGLQTAAEKYNLSPTTPEALAPLYTRLRMTQQIATNLYLGMRDFLGGMALQKPIAIVVEDLHWADLGSKELLSHLIDHRGKNRIMYTVTTRPEFDADWLAARQGIERISLGPLSKEAMIAMTRDRLEIAEVSPELSEYIVRRSRGNPHYLLEILRSLTEKGVLSDESPGAPTHRDDMRTNQAVGAVVRRERILNDGQREKVDRAKDAVKGEAQGLVEDIKNVANAFKGLFSKGAKGAKVAADKAREIKDNLEPTRTETEESKQRG